MPRRSPPAALVAALLAAVLAASVAGGWTVASQVSGDPPAVPAAADRAEPPYDAGDPADPPPLAAVAPPAEPAPAPEEPSGVVTATGTPAPPASPAPAPATAPVADPPVPAAPESPPPAPAAPPAPPDRTVTPYVPPPAIGIAAEALPDEGRAWARLLEVRRASAPGSQERADIDWLVDFARAAATPGQPEGRRATARRALRVNAWWFGTRQSPGERVIARDPDGVILTYKRGHGFMVNPVATLGRWRGLNDLWTPAQLAESMLPMLVERSHDGREWAALEYFDVPGRPDAVRPGVSGMAQSRAVSAFAKAYSNTGDVRFLQAAQRVLRSFAVPVDAGGVLARVPDPAGGPPGPWYPERAYPDRPAWTGAALNGFMVTIIELRRAARSLDSGAGDAGATTATPTAPDPAATTGDAAATAELARDLADRAEASLVRFIPLHDSGTWSYYGLLTPGKPWRSYLADLNYHCYHVALLRTLATLYPGSGHGALADRWQGYVDAKGATCPAR